MTIPIISDLLGRIFGPSEDMHSRDDVKRRLQIVLAHDRLALDPQALEMMRQEIIAVVSRYVEVDFDSLEFSIATDQRMTALTANLPIKRIRPLGKGADQPIEPEDEAEEIELVSASEAVDAKATLKRFEADSSKEPDLVHPPLDIDRSDRVDLDRVEDDLDLSEADSEESLIAQVERLEETDTASLEETDTDLDADNLNTENLAADSLNPDSLNPDSLDPDSLDEDSSETEAPSEENLAVDVPEPDVPDMSVTGPSAQTTRPAQKKAKPPRKAP